MSSVGEPSEGTRNRAGGYTGCGRSSEPKKAGLPEQVVLGDEAYLYCQLSELQKEMY
jgi:hypothetical protein